MKSSFKKLLLLSIGMIASIDSYASFSNKHEEAIYKKLSSGACTAEQALAFAAKLKVNIRSNPVFEQLLPAAPVTQVVTNTAAIDAQRAAEAEQLRQLQVQQANLELERQAQAALAEQQRQQAAAQQAAAEQAAFAEQQRQQAAAQQAAAEEAARAEQQRQQAAAEQAAFAEQQRQQAAAQQAAAEQAARAARQRQQDEANARNARPQPGAAEPFVGTVKQTRAEVDQNIAAQAAAKYTGVIQDRSSEGAQSLFIKITGVFNGGQRNLLNTFVTIHSDKLEKAIKTFGNTNIPDGTKFYFSDFRVRNSQYEILHPNYDKNYPIRLNIVDAVRANLTKYQFNNNGARISNPGVTYEQYTAELANIAEGQAPQKPLTAAEQTIIRYAKDTLQIYDKKHNDQPKVTQVVTYGVTQESFNNYDPATHKVR